MLFIISIIIIFRIIINFIIRLKLMGRPKGSQSKARKVEQSIKFGNYHLDLVKHPENVYAIHLCIANHNLYGYCTGYLSMSLDTWTHFVNAVIPKVNLPRYGVVTICRSSGLFLVTWNTFSVNVTRSTPLCLYKQGKLGYCISYHFSFELFDGVSKSEKIRTSFWLLRISKCITLSIPTCLLNWSQ